MRIFFSLAVMTAALSGCATTGHSYADDRPPIGVQKPQPVCSSGPGGKTAACASTMLLNSALPKQ